MFNKTTVNIIMLITLILLVMFIQLKPNQNEVIALSTVRPEAINNIILHRENGNIIFKKTTNHWHMLEPYKIRAHDFRINNLLSLLTQQAASHYKIQDIELKTYGLQTPRAHIQFNSTHLFFGKANPVNSMRYIQNLDHMYLVHDETYPLIRSQPSSFVSLNLLNEKHKVINIKQINSEHLAQELEKINSIQKVNNADQIQTQLQNWQFAKAFSVHAYMKRKSLGKIQLTFDNQAAYEFEISEIQPWLILGRKDLNIEYHLDGSQLSSLLNLQ